jgi:hypothetical protein
MNSDAINKQSLYLQRICDLELFLKLHYFEKLSYVIVKFINNYIKLIIKLLNIKNVYMKLVN